MAQGVYTGKDRRKSVRFRVDCPVKVHHKGGDFETRGTDFNDDAISIVHEEALEIGTAVSLEVTDELGNQITLKGEVARTSPADESDQVTMVIKAVGSGSGQS